MYDVVVIGAGIIGTCITRELMKYDIKALIVDKENDFSAGTTKANSAIIHAGYDAPHDTKKGIFNAKGNLMYDALCKELNIRSDEYMKQLTKNQLTSIVSYIRKYYKTGQKIDSDRIANIRKLIKISSYKGLRHFKGLPVRGQRTKTNAKTSRRVNRKI